MTEQTVLVRNKLGIHVRPAERIAQTANRFLSKIGLKNGECRVNAKSILGILALEAGLGTEITIAADGPDERDAAAAIAALFEAGFGEELGET
ncbi:MAG: HPr family phosphocarrier protein [Candidatus Eisenbacteria bacterium]|nr:HPr family phosphocarrier protein [Candidatus Eisenbacteria bacterium]